MKTLTEAREAINLHNALTTTIKERDTLTKENTVRVLVNSGQETTGVKLDTGLHEMIRKMVLARYDARIAKIRRRITALGVSIDD